MLFVPKDYAHGIGFYGKENILLYHLSEYRFVKYERGISYNDQHLKINWNIKKPVLSTKDKNHPSILDVFK